MTNDMKNETMVQKSIAGKSYSLRVSPTAPWTRTMSKRLVSLVTMPLHIASFFVLSVAMATPLRQSLMSMFIPAIMKNIDREFKAERKTLLADITENSTVLDVGSGGGAYLQYCTKARHVVAVEPETKLHPIIQEAGKDLQSLSIVNDLDEVVKAGAMFDFVILGNVLCEVPDIKETLKQVDSLLPFGGKVYFSEHIGRPVGSWARTFQDLFNPFWNHVMAGCNCNRDTLDFIQAMDGWDVVSWKYEHVQAAGGPFVLGLAVKK